MEKSTPLRTTTTVAALILFSSGCRKAIDIISSPQNGLTDCKTCAIRQITVHLSDEFGSDTVVYTFSYNAAGDPLTVKNTAVRTGNPNVVFKYDKYGRLTETIRPYENGAYESWQKYTYNRLNQIVSDTQYIFGTYFDSIPVAYPQLYGYTVTQFLYDPLNRIVGRTDTYTSPSGTSSQASANFAYDANGNLQVPGATYDRELNIRRTNTIWMFLSNNYSVSNAFRATAYNSHGLPLSFVGANEVLPQIVPVGGQFEVDYACP